MMSSDPAPSEIYQSLESMTPSLSGSLTTLHTEVIDCKDRKREKTVDSCEWPLFGSSPITSPPQSPTQQQSTVEVLEFL